MVQDFEIPAAWLQGTHILAPLPAIYAEHRLCARPGCPHYKRVRTSGYCCKRCYFNKGHGENCTGRHQGCIFLDEQPSGSTNTTRKKRNEKECDRGRHRDRAHAKKSRSPATSRSPTTQRKKGKEKDADMGKERAKKRRRNHSALHFYSSRSRSASSHEQVRGSTNRTDMGKSTDEGMDMLQRSASKASHRLPIESNDRCQ